MEEISTSELILMDDTFLNKITQRKELIERFPDSVLGAKPDAHAAVREIYSWLTSTYLPSRYPTMFQLIKEVGIPKSIRNLADGVVYPLEPPESMVEALGNIGSMVDEDLLFMLPSPDGDGYMLSAFVNCFANGSSTRDRLHKKLRDIHGLVPGYKNRLANRVDQWFDNLEVGKIVKRSNVSKLATELMLFLTTTITSGQLPMTIECSCLKATFRLPTRQKRREMSTAQR